MMRRKEQLDTLAISLLLACCLFWGLQQVMVKATLAELPPLFQSTVRAAGASLLVWAWCRWRGIALFERDGSLWLGEPVTPSLLAALALVAAGIVLVNRKA